MRSQECRKHIQKTGKVCKLSEKTMDEVQKVLEFVEDHSQISDLSTDAAKALMDIPDPILQQKAISHVENALNRKTPTGGTYKKRLTKPEVEKVIKKVLPPETVKKESCVLKPSDSEKEPEPTKTKPSDAFCYQPGEAPKASDAPVLSLAQQQAAKEQPAPSQQIHPGSKVTINPVVIDDTLREAPGFTRASGNPSPAPAPAAPVLNPKEEMERRAQAFIELISNRLQIETTDLMRNHHWQAKDVLCLGIDALVEKEGKSGRGV
jgi:hypothetical protein